MLDLWVDLISHYQHIITPLHGPGQSLPVTGSIDDGDMISDPLLAIRSHILKSPS